MWILEHCKKYNKHLEVWCVRWLKMQGKAVFSRCFFLVFFLSCIQLFKTCAKFCFILPKTSKNYSLKNKPKNIATGHWLSSRVAPIGFVVREQPKAVVCTAKGQVFIHSWSNLVNVNLCTFSRAHSATKHEYGFVVRHLFSNKNIPLSRWAGCIQVSWGGGGNYNNLRNLYKENIFNRPFPFNLLVRLIRSCNVTLGEFFCLFTHKTWTIIMF